ncbi:hypothetical protein WCLP8_2760002 [uncultured Gammaproteobacteria bacterium]
MQVQDWLRSWWGPGVTPLVSPQGQGIKPLLSEPAELAARPRPASTMAGRRAVIWSGLMSLFGHGLVLAMMVEASGVTGRAEPAVLGVTLVEPAPLEPATDELAEPVAQLAVPEPATTEPPIPEPPAQPVNAQ